MKGNNKLKYLNPIYLLKLLFIRSEFKFEKRNYLVSRLDKITELPLIVFAFAMVPLLLGPLLWDLTPEEVETFRKLDNVIWSVFVIDFAIKLVISPQRLLFVKEHWLEALCCLPNLQPIRVLRIIVIGTKAVRGFTRLGRADFLFVWVGALVIVGATLITSLERARNPELGSFPDALWWAIVTITTVGYGNQEPITFFGRIVAVFLMVSGVGFFAALAANLAAVFVNKEEASQLDKVEKEISQLKNQIKNLIKEIQNNSNFPKKK